MNTGTNISKKSISEHRHQYLAPISGQAPISGHQYLQAVYTSDHTAAMLAKIGRGEQLSDEDMIRYERYFRAFNRNQDNNLWQYNQDYLGENISRSIRGTVRAVIGGHELGIASWEQQKFSYTDEYVAFVEDAITDLQ